MGNRRLLEQRSPFENVSLNYVADKLLNDYERTENKPIDSLKAVYESGIIDTRKLKHRWNEVSSRPPENVLRIILRYN